MDQFSELRVAVQTDLNVDSTSDLYPPTKIDLALNRSYTKAGGLFLWPPLQDAQKTSTEENEEVYDYPQTWQPNSIWRLEVNSSLYGETPDGNPMTFDDYLRWRTENPTSTEKKWANNGTQYLFYPVPATDGDLNIKIWGYGNVEKLVADEDITIFSYSMPECNDAIVLEAVAILKAQGQNESAAEFRSKEAKQILIIRWNKIQKQQSKFEKTEPQYDVPDFFATPGRRVTTIGNFTFRR